MNSTYLPPLPFQTGGTPNPWFNIANQFVPRNLHDVIRWSRYITIQSPTTSEVIRKLATYPITEFIVDTNKDSLKTRYLEILKSFKLKEALQNIGFEYFTIGNCFVSIYFPIQRTLICPTPSCKTEYAAKNAEFVRFRQYKFVGECPHCKQVVEFTRRDSKSNSIEDMNIIKWNPEHITVNHNPITGEYEYYYTIPNALKQKIQRGDMLSVASTPWGFIEAVKNNQDFKFDKGNLFHLQNVTTGGTVEGISVPPLLSLFSLVFYQATLRKANEAIATEYLAPMRVIYPQAQTGNSDPVIAMSMRSFVDNMQDALRKHKADKNHVVIAPTPVGYTPIGGEGRNLLVSQEIQQAEDSILISLGVSRELLSGTTSWTSTSVGLRMMENLLFSYISRLQDLIEWAMAKVASYLSIEIVPITLQPFKLIDDDNFKQILLNLASQDKVSLTTLLQEYGVDYQEELEKMKKEVVERAKKAVEGRYESEQAQAMAARDKGKEMQEDEEYKVLLSKAQMVASHLAVMTPEAKTEALHRLKIEDYAMYLLATMILDQYSQYASEAQNIGQGAEGSSEQNGIEAGGEEKPDTETSTPPSNNKGKE